MQLDKEFWNQRWQNGQTGWDIGYASPAIVNYFNKIQDKDISILIPGCGNAYEAEALREKGFADITILDISDEAIARLHKKFQDHDEIKVVCENFFMHKGEYNFIIEQTFFCALDPNLRKDYAKKMNELLKPNGKLVGLMFDKKFEKAGPPFGGLREEYIPIFYPYFDFIHFEKTSDSIPQRMGNEIFIELQKK